MEVNNHTLFPYLLFRTGIDDKKMAAAVMVRVAFDIVDGIATPSDKQDWPLHAGPWESAYGMMDGDFIYKRGGVDLFVFGCARTPNNIPAKKMDVRIWMPGKMDYKITVFGDRIWESGFSGLRISDPKPFTEMPLTLANAYGGVTEWDQLKFPYANNKYGKGFIWHKENAAGTALPNIEDPKNLINKWNNWPNPVGVCNAPMNERRIRKAAEFDEDGNLIKLDHLFYNSAFPELIVDQVSEGEEIFVDGVTGSDIFKFKVPDKKLFVDLTFADKTDRRSLMIEQIGLEPDRKRGFITYRYAFNYYLNPMTKRIMNILND